MIHVPIHHRGLTVGDGGCGRERQVVRRPESRRRPRAPASLTLRAWRNAVRCRRQPASYGSVLANLQLHGCATTCARISPPGKSPAPVFVGATPSLVWTLT